MQTQTTDLLRETAVRDFDRARKRAAMRQFFARVRGRSDDLLSYDDVHDQLGGERSIKRGLQEIPLDAIVGSVGRYQDFTREFLPKRDSDEERWVGVKTAVDQMKGMPPIELYQINDAYFVADGNHRVSIARQLGASSITAYVTEVKTRVPLSMDDDPREVIRKSRFRRFLEQTNIDHLRPASDLSMTFVGQYQMMLDQIELYHRKLQEERPDVPYDEAVTGWYDTVYLPIVKLIRQQGLLRNFPSRTEADIYAFLYDHLEDLEEQLGWDVDVETAVENLAERGSRSKRAARRIWQAITPLPLEEGPEPGKWRKKQVAKHRENHLFADILVALTGDDTDINLLNRIIKLAKHDHDRLLGLHVVKKKSEIDSERVQKIKERFDAYCAEAGLVGEFAVEVGSVDAALIKRAAWVDLVVVGMTHPPDGRPLTRLGHGLTILTQRCPRPILIIPDGADIEPCGSILLPYDGSRKADEALFVAAYFVSRRPRKLTVVTVHTDQTDREDLEAAKEYLEKRGIKAAYIFKEKGDRSIADCVLETAVDIDADMLIVGGYGFRPMLHLVLGSAVDQILRELKRPIFICR